MMTDNTVVPFAQPDINAMTAQLEHQFDGFLDGAHNGMIELAWTNAEDGKLRHAEMFHTDDLDKIAQRAFEINSIPGQNVYVGAALRKPGTFPGGRAEDEDYYCTTAFYVDLDDEGAADGVTGKYRGCKPTLAVVTGRQPYKRVQLWWRLETPERDPELHRAQCLALAIELGGDRTVVNPSRVMRLGGSIAWPRKAGRVIEKTEVISFADGRPLVMMPGQLGKAFPPMYAVPAQLPATAIQDGRSPLTGKVNAAAMIARIQSGAGQWHNNVRDLVAHWVMRGLSDAEIINQAAGLTLSGYTVQQTVDEMTVALRGARTKWNKPNVETEFDPETGEIIQEAGDPIVPRPLSLEALANIAPREWLYGVKLIRCFTTLMVSPGGIGKTSFAIASAIACVSGQAILGDKPHKALNTWLYNLEDPEEEVDRRVKAALVHFGMQAQAEICARLHRTSGRDRRLIIAKKIGHDEYVAQPDVERLIEALQKAKIDVLIVDPFVMTHQVPENANEAVEFVVRQFNYIAHKARCAILLIHHTRKGAVAGDADSSRGGGSIVGAARAVFTLASMNEQDAQTLGATEEERRFLIRLDDAKANLAPRAGRAQWFKLIGVNLDNGTAEYPNGDNVQVCTAWTPPDPAEGMTVPLANEILDAIKAGITSIDGSSEPFSASQRARERWAGVAVMEVLQRYGIEKGEAQAAAILKNWMNADPPVLAEEKYYSEKQRKERFGLVVRENNRPGAHHE